VVSVIALELAVRTFGTDQKLWEFRNFLRSAHSEGQWRRMRPDPLLGYVPRPGYSGRDQAGGALLSFDENGLRVHRRAYPPPAKEAPPILVVGNSFAMGEEVSDDETFPAHLQAILDKRVLNGGVLGYGIHQMVLRADQLVPALRPDILLVSFVADDVRRAEMRVLWGIPVPYFDIVDGALQLRNVPVPPPVAAMEPLDPVRRVLGFSFLIHVVMRRLGLDDWWLRGGPMHAVRAHDQGARVSCLLMDRLRQLKEMHGLRVVVVAKYTPNAWRHRKPEFRFEREIIADLLACASRSGLETLDTGEAFEAAVQADGVDRYYIGKHMNDEGNRLAAKLSAKHLLGE
jgi:hypothetical protein